jgi:hypothetical protein
VVAELREVLEAFRRDNRRLLQERRQTADRAATSAWRAETLEQLRAIGYFQ